MGYDGTRGIVGQANYKKNYATPKLCICEVVLSNQTLAFFEKKTFNKSFGSEILHLREVWNQKVLFLVRKGKRSSVGNSSRIFLKMLLE